MNEKIEEHRESGDRLHLHLSGFGPVDADDIWLDFIFGRNWGLKLKINNFNVLRYKNLWELFRPDRWQRRAEACDPMQSNYETLSFG